MCVCVCMSDWLCTRTMQWWCQECVFISHRLCVPGKILSSLKVFECGKFSFQLQLTMNNMDATNWMGVYMHDEWWIWTERSKMGYGSRFGIYRKICLLCVDYFPFVFSFFFFSFLSFIWFILSVVDNWKVLWFVCMFHVSVHDDGRGHRATWYTFYRMRS